MSSTARAEARIEVSLPIPYILIVDDDEKFLRKAREFFVARKFGVDTARTPEEAKSLIEVNGPDKYLLVATDIDFADLSRIRGDNFVLENRDLFGKAKKVVISGGQWLNAERRKELEAAGISFQTKAPSLPQTLAEITKAESQRREHDLHRIIQKAAERITGVSAHIKVAAQGSVGTAAATALAPAPKTAEKKTQQPLNEFVLGRLKRTMIKWLKTRREPDKPVLAYGRQVYSANDLVVEVDEETNVGLAHVKMLLEEFEHSLGLDKHASHTADEHDE